jgi:hypothetical protein
MAAVVETTNQHPSRVSSLPCNGCGSPISKDRGREDFRRVIDKRNKVILWLNCNKNSSRSLRRKRILQKLRGSSQSEKGRNLLCETIGEGNESICRGWFGGRNGGARHKNGSHS